MRQSVDQQAAALQRRINEKIADALAEPSEYECEQVAKRIAGELTEGTGWEYQIIAAIGAQPRAVVTRYGLYRVVAMWEREAEKKSLP